MASRPWSAIEIETKMATIMEAQDEAIADLKGYGEAFAVARRDYEVCKAQAWLNSRADATLKTDAARTATAVLAAADLRMAKDIAESAWIAQREVVKTLMSEADTCRSLCRSARDLTDAPGFGNGAR